MSQSAFGFVPDILKFLRLTTSQIKLKIRACELLKPWGSEQESFLTPSVFRMFTLMNLLMGDEAPQESPIFLHVRYDYENVIKSAAQLYREGNKGPIYIDGTEGQHRNDPYPNGIRQVIWHGFGLWAEQLVKHGVDLSSIKLTQPAYNTPDETNEMLRIAKEEDWDSVILIGNSYQMLRIVLGTIKWMEKNNFWLKCYFHSPNGYDWSMDMKGPQGNNDRALINQIREEFVRIPEYQLKNDLCTLQQAINYINYGRDTIVNHKLSCKI